MYATLHQRGSHSKMTFRSCWSYLGGAIFGLALESTGGVGGLVGWVDKHLKFRGVGDPFFFFLGGRNMNICADTWARP